MKPVISGGFRGQRGGSFPLSKQGAEATSRPYGRARALCDRLSPTVQSASPIKNLGSATTDNLLTRCVLILLILV